MTTTLAHTTQDGQAAESLPDRLDIVIPYVTSTVAWDELRYALRSIAKNANFNFRLFIVSDRLPEWMNPEEVTLIKVKQIHGVTFAKAFDQYRKLHAIVNHPDVSANFVYAYDDQLWMKNTKEEHFEPKLAYNEIRNEADLNTAIPGAGGNWKQMFLNSIEILKKMQAPCFNYETHLPRRFHKETLKELLESLKLNEKSVTLVSTLYFNLTRTDEAPVLIGEQDPNKGQVRKSLTKTQIDSVLKRARWIDYNNAGLTNIFKEVIQKKFPVPSRFEI